MERWRGCSRREKHSRLIDEFAAKQFLFFRQWKRVHAYARSKGVKIIGDMPIYGEEEPEAC